MKDKKLGPADVRRVADAVRSTGMDITGCSFCATHAPRAASEPQPCPYCGRMVDPNEDADLNVVPAGQA